MLEDVTCRLECEQGSCVMSRLREVFYPGEDRVLQREMFVAFQALRQQNAHRLIQISSRRERWFQFRSNRWSWSSHWACARALKEKKKLSS